MNKYLNHISVSDSVRKINLKHTNTKTLTLSHVHYIANKLCRELSNEDRFDYYCKVAWNLPENIIWSDLESAKKGRDPQRLFSWLCKQKMKQDEAL